MLALTALALSPLAATAARAQTKTQDRLVETRDDKTITLFKIITVRDDIIIGLDRSELAMIGGGDAGAVARALATRGELSAWQYGVRRGPNNEPQQAPTRKVGLLSSASLRVEPYASPYPVLPHE
jgi:hypothetical protein